MSRTVVIADDDDDVRLLLRVVLGHETDFEIIGEASTPDECLAVAERLQPEILVIDHEFRGHATGMETAPLLRTKCPSAYIVMFSAYDHVRDSSHRPSAIDAFVLKTDITSLAATLRRLVE